MKLNSSGYLSTYIKLHCICFFLYAVLGKGFAYTGHPPFFIGEALILVGSFAAVRTRKLNVLFQSTIGLWLTAFTIWELSCTIPYMSRYGLDTFRDAMLWGYSSVAWVIAAVLLSSTFALDLLLQYYRRFIGAIVTLAPVMFLATYLIRGSLPEWPGTGVSIPAVKGGDTCVHIAGAMAFFLAGLTGKKPWWVIPAIIGFLAGGIGNRGGMVAFVVAIAVTLFLFPNFNKMMPIVGGILVILTVFSVFDIQITLPGGGPKKFSADQIFQNVSSLAGLEDQNAQSGLDETKQWRLAWWNSIINYTIHGPHFWTGKGFGINLMVDDGVGRNENSFPGLRSPHNSHLNFLARSGVPGISLWLGLQFAWALSIFSEYKLARKRGMDNWSKLFGWLLAYWVAFMINASFDVSLEGPVCGIPFWTIFGIGWASCLNFKQARERQLRPPEQLTEQHVIGEEQILGHRQSWPSLKPFFRHMASSN